VTPDALAVIHAAAFPDDPWCAAYLTRLIADPSAVLVSEAQGFILLRVILDEAEILTFAVTPTAQGQGIGTRLLADALAQAKLRGAARVFLEVAADNASARALYARAGFMQTGLRNSYYRRPNGAAVDALLLERKLA
jgi:ribosomal-protein-alanine N-acetyltransferase